MMIDHADDYEPDPPAEDVFSGPPSLSAGTHRIRRDLPAEEMVSILTDLGITVTTGSTKNPEQAIINLHNGLVLMLPDQGSGYKLATGHSASPSRASDVLVNLNDSLEALRRITSVWTAQSESLGFHLPKKHWAAFELTAQEKMIPTRTIKPT